MKANLTRDLVASVGVCAVFAVLTATVPDGRVVMLGTFMAFVALAVSLDLLVGTTGMLSLGHAAFFGAGAYLSTILVQELGWPLPLAGLAAIGLVAAAALVVGVAAARTVGLYFAIVSFAFGELLVQLVNNTTSVSGGSEGLPVEFGLGAQMPFGWSIYRYFCLWIVVAAMVTLVVTALVRNTHLGLRLTAVRESENLTRGLGFNPTTYKTAIFVMASSLAALIGVVYAPMAGFINPSLMNVEQSIYILGLLIVGGTRSVRGAFLGVALLATLPQYLELDPVIRPVIVGVAMAAVVLLAPDHGLIGLPGRLRERFRRPDRPKGGGRAAPPAAGGGSGPVAAGSAPGPMPEGGTT